MAILGIIFIVIGVIIGLFFGIQILILAFKESPIWGLGSIFLPVVSLIFVIMHRDKTKSPFLRGLIAIPFYLIGDVLAGSAEEDRSKKNRATICINQLVISCDAFFEEYQALPMATTSINDTEQATDNQLMATLVGKRSAEKENPKFLTFFSWHKARDGKGGFIIRNGKMRLTDPWGKPYRVVLDYDYNNQLREPLESKIISDRRVIAYSYGPDRMSGTPETNADNICSWRRE